MAVVTGGAVRVGRALCLMLARNGARICLHYGRSRDAAEQTALDIRALGGEVVTVQSDLLQPELAAETILSAAVQSFGRINVLVNSAAIFEPGTLRDTTPDDWDRHQRINLLAPVCLSRRFADHVPSDGQGAIINIADWRALRPQPGHLAYTLSKAGLVCLTQILAQELAPRIRVNAIAPGAILPSTSADPSEFEQLAEVIPLGRTGHPGDIAGAALYLLQSDFVTGEVLHVTGGQHLCIPERPTLHD
ncbi:MAG: SDR family oxidoreductase [Planctomycetaceae bacterium]